MRLFLCGDVMTGRGLDQVMGQPGDPTLHEPWVRSAREYVDLAELRSGPIPRPVPPSYIWGEALPVLEEEDVSARIVNLETAVTDRGDPWPDKGIHYRMHPANVDCIAVAAIDCCVLANNHILDWSYSGLTQTLKTLHNRGMATTGAGEDVTEASRPAVIETEQGRVIIVGLGAASSGIPRSWSAGSDRPGVAFTPEPSKSDVESIARRAGELAGPEDVIVVSIHWGGNWGYDIPSTHRRFAQGLIDNGVDVVHGHSSHHPLGVEVYRGRPILYGCGDLINDYEGIRGHEEYHPDLGAMYFVSLLPGGNLERLDLVLMRMRRFRLELAPTEEVRWLAATLSREGKPLGTEVVATGAGRLSVIW